VGCTGGLQDAPLDVGNPNWLHGHLSTVFPDVWGIDINRAKLEALRARGYENVYEADAQDFSIPERFDTIVAGELIEHLGNPSGFLRSAREHLAPGGCIVLSTPYFAGLPNVLYAWLKYPKTCANPEHTMWFCPTTLSTLAEQNGLRVEVWSLLLHIPRGNIQRGGNGLHGLGRKALPAVAPLIPNRMRSNSLVARLVPS
jgi:SAM-dependent methyltransferase